MRSGTLILACCMMNATSHAEWSWESYVEQELIKEDPCQEWVQEYIEEERACLIDNPRKVAATAAFLYIYRDTIGSNNLDNTDYFPHHGTRLDTKKDYNAEWEPAWRLALQGFIGCEWNFGITYTGYGKWTKNISGALDDDLSLDMANAPQEGGIQKPMGITNALQQSATLEKSVSRNATPEYLTGVRYQSTMSSLLFDVAVHGRRTFSCFDLGLTAQYFSLEEDFTLSIYGTFQDGIPDTTLGLGHETLTSGEVPNYDQIIGGVFSHVSGGQTGFVQDSPSSPELHNQYNAEAKNRLIGGAVDLSTPSISFCSMTLDSLIRMGVYYNDVTGNLTEYATETNRDESNYKRQWMGSASTLAFSAMAKVGVSYTICRATISAQYEALLLSGLALAADQWFAMEADNAGHLTWRPDTCGTLVYHGPSVALTICW